MFTEGAGAAGDGWYFSCGCLDATVAPQAKAFSDAYQAKFNTPPSTYSPESYDATNALIQAIKTAASSGTATRAVGVRTRSTTSTTRASPPPSSSSRTVRSSSRSINLYQQKNGKIGLLGDITKQS